MDREGGIYDRNGRKCWHDDIAFLGQLYAEDFLTRWNAITVRKRREKGQFLGISHLWIEVLGLLPYEGITFIPNLSS